MRRPSSGAIVIAVFTLLVWWVTRPKPEPAAAPPAAVGSRPLLAAPAPAAPARPVSTVGQPVADAQRSALLDDLNQPAGTIQSDLRLVQEVFAAWRTNFPRDGNPVGENAEITRALTGANALGLALVPKDHPAISPAGELTDRWGTPFRFHQLSGERMEIRSAGPDRRFGTADDAVLTP
jgi:hypothetical protein